jgi:hypothetical protein
MLHYVNRSPSLRIGRTWKGAGSPHDREIPLRIEIPRNRGRNPGKDAGQQVWDTILKRDTATMGHIHVCDDSAAPCDDPEDQMVVAVRDNCFIRVPDRVLNSLQFNNNTLYHWSSRESCTGKGHWDHETDPGIWIRGGGVRNTQRKGNPVWFHDRGRCIMD